MLRDEFKKNILKSTRDFALCETVMQAYDSLFEVDQTTGQDATETVPVDANKLADPDNAGVVNAKIADAQKTVKEAENAKETAVSELVQTIAATGGSDAGTNQQATNVQQA